MRAVSGGMSGLASAGAGGGVWSGLNLYSSRVQPAQAGLVTSKIFNFIIISLVTPHSQISFSGSQ